jgi:hypothetical protein
MLEPPDRRAALAQHGVNLGTLLRTCDAVGACMAVPRLPWVPEALKKGNTLRKASCVHWVYGDVGRWLQRQPAETQILGVELTDESIRLAASPQHAPAPSSCSATKVTAYHPKPWTCSMSRSKFR